MSAPLATPSVPHDVRPITVAVIALGKMGLPIAVQIAAAGHTVVGADVDETTVDLINAGKAPFPGEAGLAEALAELVPAGRLRATTSTAEAVAQAEFVVAVPPLMVDIDGNTDWRIIDAVLEAVGPALKEGTCFALETTVPVGTTRDRIAPRLAELSGLELGVELNVGFSPERVFSGRVFEDLAKYPKLVGGVTLACERKIAEHYRSFLTAEVQEMGSAEAAELTKLVETTYREVNIALANEFAMYADRVGIDLGPVIAAANSQPFSHVHRPGVAVGGHCIPIYPRFYLQGDPHAKLVAHGRIVNEEMPAHAVSLLARDVELDGKRVLVLGAAYRGGVKETAFSGVFPVVKELERLGAIAQVVDPLYDEAEITGLGLAPWDGQPVDGAIIQADHAEYRQLRPEQVPGAVTVVDGRGTLDGQNLGNAGVRVRRIGGGN
ncbi:MAG: nucleotide sugar dehydrogenase [Solirubrobacteraceae bacterium]|nr:nucleotide sugar dehydrogenase [Solirubrobacteraceae bacterium]